MESNLKKCTRCKKNYDLEHYTKGDKILKYCLKCRNVSKKSRNKTKCIHGRRKSVCKDCCGDGICIHSRQKYQCIDCGGVGICIHNIYKRRCVVCGGSSICIHDKRKYDCKICGDTIHLTIKLMIHHSKQKDKKLNLFDELNFVNYDYLKNLIIESNDRCCYCSCELQYIHYNHSLATIERLNNNLGHIIGNCKIACKKCNCTKVGSTINPQL